MTKKPNTLDRSRESKSCNTTDRLDMFKRCCASDESIVALKDALIAIAAESPLDALIDSREIYSQNGRAHHAWLRCCLAVTYASALRMNDDFSERKRFYGHPFFADSKRIKEGKLLVHSMHLMVGSQKGGIKMASRYAKALKPFFARGATVGEVEEHLKENGVEKLYRSALAAKYKARAERPLTAADDDADGGLQNAADVDDKPRLEAGPDKQQADIKYKSKSNEDRALNRPSKSAGLAAAAARARSTDVLSSQRLIAEVDKDFPDHIQLSVLVDGATFEKAMSRSPGSRILMYCDQEEDEGTGWKRFVCTRFKFRT